MQHPQSRFEIGQPLGRRLDHELPFRLALDLTLPPVSRHHRAVDVHARREVFLHQRSRDGIGAIIVRHRRQDKDEV